MKHKNELPTPFPDGDENQSIELLRVWINSNAQIAYSANFAVQGWKDDSSIYGVLLADLTQKFAWLAAKNHGQDPKHYYDHIVKDIKRYLND